MRNVIAFLGLLSISSTVFAFSGVCVYADNKVVAGKPNGSILTVPVSLESGDSRDLVSLSESSDLIQAKLVVSGESKYLIVADSKGKILSNKESSLDSGASFMASLSKSQVSLVCVPNR